MDEPVVVDDLADDVEPDVVVASPVPVGIDGRVTTSEEPADFGTYKTIVLVGTEDKQIILPYDLHRVRASVTCSGTGPVWLGTEAQCAAVKAGNTAGGGFLLPTGFTLPVGHKQAVWLIPDGSHSATVSIVQERMQA